MRTLAEQQHEEFGDPVGGLWPSSWSGARASFHRCSSSTATVRGSCFGSGGEDELAGAAGAVCPGEKAVQALRADSVFDLIVVQVGPVRLQVVDCDPGE